MDKNFPDMGPNAKNLPMAPKDLGMSRADLWAFSGLVSLAWYQKNSKDLCKTPKTIETYMCEDKSTPCFTEFPEDKIFKLFKTGRTDCDPRDPNDKLHLYRPKGREFHPSLGFNGKMTMEYFKKGFNLEPSEATALMGAHTVGFFNGVNSKIDYAWVRAKSEQPNLFNNKYYKVLSAQPAKVKDGLCIGNAGELNYKTDLLSK